MSDAYNVKTMQEEAKKLKKSKKYNLAFEKLQSAIELCTEKEHLRPILSEIYFDYALLFDLFDDPASSRNYYQKAYELLDKNINYGQLGTLQLKIAICNAKLEDQASEDAFLLAVNYFISLAETYENKKFYTNANQFYTFAEKMYILAKNVDKQEKAAFKGILMDIEYYKDICFTANMYNYSNDKNNSQTFAWRALSLSMEILRKTLNTGFDIKAMVNRILPYVDFCKNALLRIEDEITPVIELKIDELYKMFYELTDDIPDDPEDVDLWIETHTTSLQFMLPQVLPSYLFLTVDGRLFYHTESSANYSRQVSDEVDNTLFAGVLSAIRFAFQEKISPVRGLIDEIKVGGDTLLIENTDNIVVIVITSFVYPELRKFISKLSSDLEFNYGTMISKWLGDKRKLNNMIEFIDKEIVNKFDF